MESIFLIAAIVSIIFFIAKFMEMRFIEKENKPLKLLMRDSLLVYVSVVCGYFILDQLKPVMQHGAGNTMVFTDNPEF
jgi:hypothetical protein